MLLMQFIVRMIFKRSVTTGISATTASFVDEDKCPPPRYTEIPLDDRSVRGEPERRWAQKTYSGVGQLARSDWRLKKTGVSFFSWAAMFACPSLVVFRQPAQWAEFAANQGSPG
jgi:hypothetical protein